MTLKLDVLPDAAAAASHAADCIATEARLVLRERQRFLLALSGGSTPLPMFRSLADKPLAWEQIHLFQVDERFVPDDSPDRNWKHITSELARPAGLKTRQLHPMPVEAGSPEAAATAYASTLEAMTGTPPILDLVHLGLGDDGHTASLFPADAATRITDRWTAATTVHHGHRRITLTLPTLARARSILWLICGAGKTAMLQRLLAADSRIPAGLVPGQQARIVADEAAARGL